MKNKKLIISLIIILVISLTASIAVYANLDNSGTIPADEERYIERVGADKTKILELAGEDEAESKVNTASSVAYETTNETEFTRSLKLAESGTKLNYKETLNYSETNRFDIYTDDNSNEYRYDMKGRLMGFTGNAEATDTIKGSYSGEAIVEEQAISISVKYANMMFGDLFKEFEYYKASYNSDNAKWKVTFIKKYGEEKFIGGPVCYVNILSNGSLADCKISLYNDYENFEESLLEGITEQMMIEYTQKRVLEDYSDNALYEINGFSLVNKNDKFYVCSSVTITTYDDIGESWDEIKEYYYALG